jgi:ABC-type multidrug transport system ATPase subunit/pSer/pThr/pTyr-binding forkhead associated (FHA) protein
MVVVTLTNPKITLQEGPNPGQEFELSQTLTVIGRLPGAEFEIIIEAPGVSRRHAQIRQVDNQYVIEDLSSSNGTFLNGRRITGSELLQSGDIIGLGQAVKMVCSGLSAPEVQDVRDLLPTIPEAPGGIAQTVIGEALPTDDQLVTPPQLLVTDAGAMPEVHTLMEDSITIGRSVDNDITIASNIVSRSHARLERADLGYQLIVLPQASNPIYVDGYPVTGPRRLRHGDKLRIGGQDPGSMVTMTYNSPAEAITEEAMEISFETKSMISIGRDPANDIVLDMPQVSRNHAEIERVGQRFRLIDLNSSNGTFVNDEQIVGETWLKPKDTVRIGSYRFVVGEEALAQFDDSMSLRVEAIGLNKWVRKDLNILQNISLLFQPREFVVVVGQSGGGKSTLVDAIAGYRPATHGQVFVNGTNVYKNFDAIRNIIGFVPQKDIIHTELTVFQALDYTAQLRMPPDTSKEERHARVMEVLDELDLAHRKDVQISGLSGGQQKRVSIGVELLTKPGLFFLDEPTSGLDPGTETALMQLMRRLADQGRTIVLITHATKNVMLADKVLFLARGGYLTWFGPPDEALAYFDQYRSDRERRTRPMEFDQIYVILEDTSKGTPEEWAERYQNHPAFQEYIRAPLEVRTPELSAAAPAQPAAAPVTSQTRRQVSSLRQFLILSSRNINILLRDRFSLALMLAAAPLVGLLDVILAGIMGSDPFNFVDGDMPSVLTTLFLLTIYGVIVGGLAQMREIVKEGDIYKRERLVNLKIIPYILSKVWVAVLLALYQTAAYVIIHYLAFDMPGGSLEFVIIYISLALATLAGMMLGLFASALAPSSNAAPLIVILLMLPQIVLGGALVPLPDFVSAPMSTRWAFQAFMGTVGVGSDVAADVCWNLTEEEQGLLTLEDKENLGCKCLGLNALRQESCNFPGVGKFFTEAIDQLPPTEPPPPPERPLDPDVPDPPAEPEDQSDTVAVADYLAALQDYQTLVEQIQADAEAEFAEYESEIEVYQAQVVSFQEELVNWQITREAAALPAEGLIYTFAKDFSWTFVDKNNPDKFWPFIYRTWIVQGVIISVLFFAILLLQKRKDSK